MSRLVYVPCVDRVCGRWRHLFLFAVKETWQYTLQFAAYRPTGAFHFGVYCVQEIVTKILRSSSHKLTDIIAKFLTILVPTHGALHSSHNKFSGGRKQHFFMFAICFVEPICQVHAETKCGTSIVRRTLLDETGYPDNSTSRIPLNQLGSCQGLYGSSQFVSTEFNIECPLRFKILRDACVVGFEVGTEPSPTCFVIQPTEFS